MSTASFVSSPSGGPIMTLENFVHYALKTDACYYSFLIKAWNVISILCVILPSVIGLLSLTEKTEVAKSIYPLLSDDFVAYVALVRLFFSYHVASKCLHFIFVGQKSYVPIKAMGLISICVSCASMILSDLGLHPALSLLVFIISNLGLAMAYGEIEEHIRPVKEMDHEELEEYGKIYDTKTCLTLLWTFSVLHLLFNAFASPWTDWYTSMISQGFNIPPNIIKAFQSVPGFYFGFYSYVVCRLLNHFCYQFLNPTFLYVRKDQHRHCCQ